MTDDPHSHVEGHAFLRHRHGSDVEHFNTRLRVSIDNDGCQWAIRPITGDDEPQVVESTSIEVRRHLRRVMTAMQRASPRPVRAVPKPHRTKHKTTGLKLPAGMVICPHCQGERLIFAVECETCEGRGAVSHSRAQDYIENHD